MSDSPIIKKICLLGDFAVGKTSLIRRFVDRQFSDEYLSTVGVKISRKKMESPGQNLELIIWDIEGGSDFKALETSYLSGSSGAILVGDLQRNSTIEHLNSYLEKLKSICPKGEFLVALNKSDLFEDPPSMQEITSYFNIPPEDLIQTSAKSGEGVDDLFHKISNKLLD